MAALSIVRRYSVTMRQRHPHRTNGPLPDLWLVSDARNDRVLEQAMARLPRGSGLIFRHYHLAPVDRLARYRKLLRLARRRGIAIVLAGSAAEARRWRADGSYGPPATCPGLRLATAHGLREIAMANRSGAAAVLISPVHPTRSHPGQRVLGPVRFRLLAARALMPAIALGGMSGKRARGMSWQRWAAIDGLSHGADVALMQDS